ncbi:MAG TPA: hypothetical protein VEK07_11190 [Polyangiaceae bacterium]|nr:hypothetical protein [Polyangiaceae bacterium]
MPASSRLRVFLVVFSSAGVVSSACGNLIIPSNSNPDEDAGGGSENGNELDDGSADALPPPNCDAGVFPVALACTGLYSDWGKLTLAPDVTGYSLDPRVQLWVDGATEREWVWLPPGQKVTTTDLNNWVFPNGTKFWEELSLLGARVETRFLWKMSNGDWFRTTYVWNVDQTAAPELVTGTPNAFGLPYDIPSVSQCDQCHLGTADYPLGFEIVGLAMGGSGGLNLQALEQQNLLSNAPAVTPSLPGSDGTIVDDAGVMGSALAYLHSNCGTSCHNRSVDANAGQTGLFTKLTVGPNGALPSVEQTDTWLTAYDVPSSYTPSGYDAGGFWRLHPGDAAHSTIPWMASRRNSSAQMPPIDTELPDENEVSYLDTWTDELPQGVTAGAPAGSGSSSSSGAQGEPSDAGAGPSDAP